MSLQVILDPVENDLVELRGFLNSQLRQRPPNSKIHRSNYDDSEYSMIGLIRKGRFARGGIAVWKGERNEIEACSGFYPVGKTLVCGVRTLVNIQGVGGIGLHAEKILPWQVGFARDHGYHAAAVSFNPANYRLLKWIEKFKAQDPRLSIFRDFQTTGSEIQFNSTPQIVYIVRLNPGLLLQEVESQLAMTAD